ncbi:unnamed protein product [Auanema sp. JU1783]|nr:unnamed protein product [Auanema sp. JU1783]
MSESQVEVEISPSPYMTVERMRQGMNDYTEWGFSGRNKSFNRIEKYVLWYKKFVNSYDTHKCLEENFLSIAQSLLTGDNRNETISQRYDFMYALTICAAIHISKRYDISRDAAGQLTQTKFELKNLKDKEENDLPSYFEYENHLKQFNQTVAAELIHEADEIVANEFIGDPDLVRKVFKKLSLLMCWWLSHENDCTYEISYNLKTEHVKAGLESPMGKGKWKVFVFPSYYSSYIETWITASVHQYEKPLKILLKMREMLEMDSEGNDVAQYFFRSPRKSLSVELQLQFGVEEEFRKIRYDRPIPGRNGRWWEPVPGPRYQTAEDMKINSIYKYIRLREAVDALI